MRRTIQPLQKPSKLELDTGSKSSDSIHKPVTDTRNGEKFERWWNPRSSSITQFQPRKSKSFDFGIQPEIQDQFAIARAKVDMLKRFENDQVVAAAEKEFKQAQEIEAAFVRDSEKLLGVAR